MMKMKTKMKIKIKKKKKKKKKMTTKRISRIISFCRSSNQRDSNCWKNYPCWSMLIIL